MSGDGPPSLDAARLEARLTGPWDLWLRYFSLGGMGSPRELEQHVAGVVSMNDHEHDVLVHALNERFDELDMDHPVPYSR